MFKVGDKIVYPSYGAGIIECIESKEVLGVNRDYFVLKLSTNQVKIMLPVDNIQNLGLRNIEEEGHLDDVYDILEAKPSKLSPNWNKRYRENLEKIKSGDICEVAEVVRDLMCMDEARGLSSGEKSLLTNSKQILISEIAMIKDYDWREAEREVVSHISNIS